MKRKELLSPIRENSLSIRGYPKATIYGKQPLTKMDIPNIYQIIFDKMKRYSVCG
jgi:hypothetical protein